MESSCNNCQSAAARDFMLRTGHHGVQLPRQEDTQSSSGAPHCQRCEVIPLDVCGPGTLYLRFPLTHTLGKVLSYLKHSSWQHTIQRGVIRIHVDQEDLSCIVLPLTELLNAIEQEDVRVLFQPDGTTLELEDCLESTSLHQFATRAQSNWLLSMMRDNRVTSVFQPILCSDGDRNIHGYECLLRGFADGQVVGAGAMLEAARQSGMLFQLDLAARRAAICGAAAHGIQEKIFVNFGPRAIYDPVNCLHSTLTLIDEVQLKRTQIIFEIVEVDHLCDTSHLERIVDYYRNGGFGVALDDLGSGYSSFNMLNKLRPDYVKLDMELTRDVQHDAYKALLARKLFEMARELELKTVAEGVECHAEWDWVRENGADFVQGYYFAKPATPPPLQVQPTP